MRIVRSPWCPHSSGGDPATEAIGPLVTGDGGAVAEQQRGLARWHQALRIVGAEGRAGLVEVERAEHPAVKEAVLAALPVLPPALCGALAAQSQRLGKLGRPLHLDHVAIMAPAARAPQGAFSQPPGFFVTKL